MAAQCTTCAQLMIGMRSAAGPLCAGVRRQPIVTRMRTPRARYYPVFGTSARPALSLMFTACEYMSRVPLARIYYPCLAYCPQPQVAIVCLTLNAPQLSRRVFLFSCLLIHTHLKTKNVFVLVKVDYSL